MLRPAHSVKRSLGVNIGEEEFLKSQLSRPETASQIALPWIIRLRYGMAVGQVWTVGVAHYALQIDLPMQWVALELLLLLASNLWLAQQAARTDPQDRMSASTLVSWIFALDVLCLTGLLMLSGGSSNPFTRLYLVHITLAATILSKRQTWMLVALSMLCFGLLFWIYIPVPRLETPNPGGGLNLPVAGMWISFTLAVLLVVMYAGRISLLLRAHEATFLRMQVELAKKDRLASLATLAAGAAHELNTPLGTIAIVAKELERFATLTSRDDAVAEDSRLIRKEVDRCRKILLRMSADGAEPAGQAMETIEVRDLLKYVCSEFPPERVQVDLPGTDRLSLRIPVHAVQQALVALVKNAIEASGPTAPAIIAVRTTAIGIAFIVKDRGNGMSAEILRRVGEPFYTTKDPNQGMGLGTFLARTLAERLEGRLTFQSTEGIGTSAILELPASVQSSLQVKAGLWRNG